MTTPASRAVSLSVRSTFPPLSHQTLTTQSILLPPTSGALAMRPTGNMQGGHYFFSLATGRVINRVRATKLPMPSEVIDRVHALARQQNANRGLVFGDRDGNPVDGEDGDW